MKKQIPLPFDKPLGKPVRKFEDTFSAFELIKETFFKEKKNDRTTTIDDTKDC